MSVSFKIARKPGRNSCISPLRVIPPSGKMHTISPCCNASRAGADRLGHRLARRPDGDDSAQPAKPAQPAVLEILGIRDHARVPRAGQAQQHAVGPTDVVGHHQHAAAGGHVFQPFHPHADTCRLTSSRTASRVVWNGSRRTMNIVTGTVARPPTRKIAAGKAPTGRTTANRRPRPTNMPAKARKL